MLAWRDVVVTADLVGPTARASMPVFRQLVVADPSRELSGIDLDRRAYRLRKRAEREHGIYFASLSARTLAYKGMLTTGQLEPFFADLSDPRYATEIALVHSRFSTNTFPSWPLAQPFRMIAHNGEINTVRGNRNWMAAREGTLASEQLGDLDAAAARLYARRLGLGQLRRGARAAAPVGPLAAARGDDDDPGGVGEPRPDGPRAARVLRVPLDAHGAVGRPGGDDVHRRHAHRRRCRTATACVPAGTGSPRTGSSCARPRPACSTSTPRRSSRRAVSSPAACSWSTPARAGSSRTRRSSRQLAAQRPYAEWVRENSVYLEQLPEREHVAHSAASVRRRQRAFGYTEEELKILLEPDGRRRRRAAGRDGLRHAGRGALRAARACCSTTSRRCSRR